MRSVSKQFAEFRVGEKPEAYGFEEFELSEVFEIVTGSLVGNLKQGNTPRITPSSRNNGLSLFTEDNNPQARYFEDIVTVSFLGDVFYQPKRVSLEMKVHGLKLKEGFGFRKGAYVATSVKKSISERYDYGTQLSSEKLKTIPIQLPVTVAGDIDWEYMEDYIATIEQKFIDQVVGINTREQEILAQLHPDAVDTEPEAYGFEDFRVGDVFETVGRTYTGPGFWSASEPRYNEPLPPMPAGSTFIPLITGSTMDNGISGWAVSTEHIDVSPCITIAPHSGYVAFQRSFVAIGQNAYAICLLHANFSLRSLMYCVCVLQKLLHVGVDYSNLASWGVVKDKIIQLPITSTGDIDWDYMEAYIAWIEERERESRALRAAREEQILSWLHQHR